MLRLQGIARPPYNVVISNVPGPKQRHYLNGARLDGMYPVSIPVNGIALNITCTSYVDNLAFGFTGCRRTVPHLQRLLLPEGRARGAGEGGGDLGLARGAPGPRRRAGRG